MATITIIIHLIDVESVKQRLQYEIVTVNLIGGKVIFYENMGSTHKVKTQEVKYKFCADEDGS